MPELLPTYSLSFPFSFLPYQLLALCLPDSKPHFPPRTQSTSLGYREQLPSFLCVVTSDTQDLGTIMGEGDLVSQIHVKKLIRASFGHNPSSQGHVDSSRRVVKIRVGELFSLPQELSESGGNHTLCF